jgi:hypothetical protein
MHRKQYSQSWERRKSDKADTPGCGSITESGRFLGENEPVSTVSVAELKSAIAAALQQVRDGQAAIASASQNIEAAQGSLTAVTAGSGHDSVATAQAALAQAAAELEQSLAATFAAAEQAETYAATL